MQPDIGADRGEIIMVESRRPKESPPNPSGSRCGRHATISEVKRLHIYNGHATAIPNGQKCPLGCDGHATDVAAGQSKRFNVLFWYGNLYDWCCLSSPHQTPHLPVVLLEWRWLIVYFEVMGGYVCAIRAHTQEPCPNDQTLQILFTVFASESNCRMSRRTLFFYWRLH
jgi:hypothetical protein